MSSRDSLPHPILGIIIGTIILLADLIRRPFRRR